MPVYPGAFSQSSNALRTTAMSRGRRDWRVARLSVPTAAPPRFDVGAVSADRANSSASRRTSSGSAPSSSCCCTRPYEEPSARSGLLPLGEARQSRRRASRFVRRTFAKGPDLFFSLGTHSRRREARAASSGRPTVWGSAFCPWDGVRACSGAANGFAMSRSDASHFVKLALTDAGVKAILTPWMNRGIRRNSTGR